METIRIPTWASVLHFQLPPHPLLIVLMQFVVVQSLSTYLSKILVSATNHQWVGVCFRYPYAHMYSSELVLLIIVSISLLPSIYWIDYSVCIRRLILFDIYSCNRCLKGPCPPYSLQLSVESQVLVLQLNYAYKLTCRESRVNERFVNWTLDTDESNYCVLRSAL